MIYGKAFPQGRPRSFPVPAVTPTCRNGDADRRLCVRTWKDVYKRQIADHVLVLREGRAIFSGTLPELEASRDPYLLQFLRREGGDEESLADAPADPRVSAALDKWFRT